MSEIPVSPEAGDRLVLDQRGKLSSFFTLSLKNGLLNLVTLTLYRFWGKTEVRRRLWATTYLNDEPFEYTGRGKELFFGFLLAIGVLVLPFLALSFAVQFLGPKLAPLLVLPLYIFLIFLLGFGRFTAFRYLSTRSSWRGVRFHLRGSPGAFGRAWLGYIMLSVVSFGWFWPAAERRLAGRLWDGLSFGDLDFKFRIEDARREGVYGAYALAWILGMVGYSAFIGVVVAFAAGMGKAPSTAETIGFVAALYLGLGALMLFFVFVMAPFRAAMLRSVAAGVGIGDVRFKLRIGWFSLGMLMLTNMLLLAISFGLLMPLVEARWRKFLIGRLKIVGAFDLSSVRQAEVSRPRTGEGLADALGIATV